MTDHGVPSTADDKYDSITCEWYSTVAVRSISISATSSVTPPSLLALCGWVVGTHTGCRPCQQLFYVFMCLEFRPHTLDLNPDVFIPGTTLVFQSRSSFHTPPCLLYPRCLNWDIPWLYSPWNLNKGCVHTDRTNLPWFNKKQPVLVTIIQEKSLQTLIHSGDEPTVSTAHGPSLPCYDLTPLALPSTAVHS